jgi:MATE family multidrug resistance protein
MNRQILRLAIPNIISNISVPLISAVDTMLMGHLSTSHLAALGVGAMIFVFLYGSFGFLRMGTTGLTAQAYGKEDKTLMANTLSRAIMIGLFIALLLILFQTPLYEVASYLMNVEDGYADKVHVYFDIRIYTAPAIFMQFALMGWFFGMQNATIPLLMTLVINFVNIALSYYLVNHLHMGIEGAAYGTVVAQYSGVLFGFIMIAKYSDILHLVNYHDTLLKSQILRFFSVNKDIFIRTIALTFVLAFFYSQAAKQGEDTLSVMILLLQFMIWMSFALDGFANAAESLVGRYYGAKDWRNFYKAIQLSFYWGGGFALLFSLAYFFGARAILELYTNQTHIINLAMPYIWLVALLPLLAFAAFIWDGVFIGMTASKSMRNAVVLSMLLFLGLFYMTRELDYSWALWGSFVMFFLFRGGIQTWIFYKKGRNLK